MWGDAAHWTRPVATGALQSRWGLRRDNASASLWLPNLVAFGGLPTRAQLDQRPSRFSTRLRLLPTFFTAFLTAALDLRVFFAA